MPVHRRNQVWEASYRWRDRDGHQHSESKSFQLKTDADMWLLSRKTEAQQGRSKRMTSFLYLFDHFYEIYKEPYLRHNTLAGWRLARKAYLSYFGDDMLIQKITKDRYQRFVTLYGSTHAHSTVLGINQRLSEVFKYAVDEGYITRSPSAGVRIGGTAKRKVEYLSVADIKKLLSYIDKATFKKRKGHTDVPSGVPYSIEFAILSGARLSEIAALQWSDIDLERGEVSITKQWDTRSGKRRRDFAPLKTQASKRVITMPSDYLKKLHDTLYSPGDEFVFYSGNNQPLQASVCCYALHTLLDKAGIQARGFHFHSLRHSHVALLLDKGIDIYAISQRLGHSRFDITLNTYAYLIKEQKKRNDQKILKALQSLSD